MTCSLTCILISALTQTAYLEIYITFVYNLFMTRKPSQLCKHYLLQESGKKKKTVVIMKRVVHNKCGWQQQQPTTIKEKKEPNMAPRVLVYFTNLAIQRCLALSSRSLVSTPSWLLLAPSDTSILKMSSKVVKKGLAHSQRTTAEFSFVFFVWLRCGKRLFQL